MIIKETTAVQFSSKLSRGQKGFMSIQPQAFILMQAASAISSSVREAADVCLD